MKASGTVKVSSWDEKTWDGQAWDAVEGAKQTHAIVEQRYEGDIEADSTTHFLMNYLDSGITHFIGMQRITGQVSDKTGSFTLQIEGDYDGKQVTATYRILEGSGTEGLAGISGTGSIVSKEDGSSDYVLDYKLD